jgi:hypothetical protein
MKIVYYFLGVIAAALMSGCATVGAIEKNYALVDRTDGIDKDEAIAIAQWDLLHDEQDKPRFRIISPDVFEGKEKTAFLGGSEFETWTVVFAAKNIFTAEFGIFPPTRSITIDKAKGRIVQRGGWGWVANDRTSTSPVSSVLVEIDKEKKEESAKNKKKSWWFW